MASVGLIYLNKNKTIHMGLAHISAVLKQNGHKVAMFDTVFMSDKEISEKIENSDIQIAMFSVNSMEYVHAVNLSNRIKKCKPDVYTLFGGWHILIDPDDVIKNDSVDMICLGEGEYAALDVADNVEKLDSITDIPNIWFKRDDKIIKNQVRELADLDELPYPDRDVFPMEYLADNGLFLFSTTRGCPYRCSYCCNYKMVDLYKEVGCRYLRHRNIQSCIDEMLYLKGRYDIQEFFFIDEMFLTNQKRVKDFCEAYVKNDIGISFGFMARVEYINEEIMKILKDAGCSRIHFGIESGNEEIRKKYLNRQMTNEQIINAFQLCKKYGVRTVSFNMIGHPFETKETIKDTFDLNRKCEPSGFQMSIMYPFVGTKIRDIFKESGLFDSSKELEDKKHTYHESYITKNNNVSFSYMKHQQTYMRLFFTHSKLFAKLSLFLPVFLLDKYIYGISLFYKKFRG